MTTVLVDETELLDLAQDHDERLREVDERGTGTVAETADQMVERLAHANGRQKAYLDALLRDVASIVAKVEKVRQSEDATLDQEGYDFEKLGAEGETMVAVSAPALEALLYAAHAAKQTAEKARELIQ